MHRCILSARGKYFCSIFTTELQKSNQIEFAMTEVAIVLLKELVDSFCTGIFTNKITQRNVQYLINFA